MTYVKVLKRVMDEASPAVGMTRVEIETQLAAVSAELKRPMGDAARIMLCGDRASLKKALAAIT